MRRNAGRNTGKGEGIPVEVGEEGQRVGKVITRKRARMCQNIRLQL